MVRWTYNAAKRNGPISVGLRRLGNERFSEMMATGRLVWSGHSKRG